MQRSCPHRRANSAKNIRLLVRHRNLFGGESRNWTQANERGDGRGGSAFAVGAYKDRDQAAVVQGRVGTTVSKNQAPSHLLCQRAELCCCDHGVLSEFVPR